MKKQQREGGLLVGFGFDRFPLVAFPGNFAVIKTLCPSWVRNLSRGRRFSSDVRTFHSFVFELLNQVGHNSASSFRSEALMCLFCCVVDSVSTQTWPLLCWRVNVYINRWIVVFFLPSVRTRWESWRFLLTRLSPGWRSMAFPQRVKRFDNWSCRLSIGSSVGSIVQMDSNEDDGTFIKSFKSSRFDGSETDWRYWSVDL